MQLVTDVHLFRSPYTVCYIFENSFLLPDEKYYQSIVGVNTGECCEIEIEDRSFFKALRLYGSLRFTANALFLQPFVKECLNSEAYRLKVLSYLTELCGYPENGVVFLKLILEPPDKEVIDYAWNERMLRLVWSRVEIENAFSWLSTLGGAYSALGDYFEHCADEAGRISVRQYKLSKMLGDDALAARSKLYSALSYAQKGKLKLSRHIVRNVYDFARKTHDKRLSRMCQGVWVKLKYLREIRNNSESQLSKVGVENGKVLSVN